MEDGDGVARTQAALAVHFDLVPTGPATGEARDLFDETGIVLHWEAVCTCKMAAVPLGLGPHVDDDGAPGVSIAELEVEGENGNGQLNTPRL